MDHKGAVVVGLGDTDDGHRELEWAAQDAMVSNRPLHVIRAYHNTEVAVPWETPEDRSMTDDLRAVSEKRLNSATAYLTESAPNVAVQTFAVEGRAFGVLCDASEDAAVTVVGSRRHGALGSAVLGSVGGHVAAAASGPVVVVRSVPGNPAEMPQVIAGVDGSHHTDGVLEFAFQYAKRHGRELRVVYCWHTHMYPGSAPVGPPPPPARAERWLAETVAGRSAEFPDVTVHQVVVRDHAVDRLVAESHSQELLVVGGRAKHPRLATLLGSVTQGVLHHATCPVAIVHRTPGA
jgi:nucleotide-binding universal stress UspA family protein